MRNEPRETCTRVSCGSQRAKIVLRRPLAGLLLVSELSTSSNLILYRYRTKKFQLDLVSSLRLYTFGVSCASVPSDSRWSIRLIGVCTGDRSRKSFERRLSCNCCLHASARVSWTHGQSLWTSERVVIVQADAGKRGLVWHKYSRWFVRRSDPNFFVSEIPLTRCAGQLIRTDHNEWPGRMQSLRRFLFLLNSSAWRRWIEIINYILNNDKIIIVYQVCSILGALRNY